MPDTILPDLQADIVARLSADEYLSDVAVIAKRDGDQDNLSLVSDALASGVAVIVMEPEAEDENINMPFGPLEVHVLAAIIEAPNFNATGKHRLSLARRAHQNLKLYHPAGYSTPLTMEKPGLFPFHFNVYEGVEDTGQGLVVKGYALTFRTRLADPTPYTQVADPTIAQVGANVTLSCATAGASIYYTTDGTHPWSGNSAATLYAGAITPAAGALLRCCAFKTGSIASNVTAEFVSPGAATTIGEPILPDLQADVVARLNADSYFTDITVLAERDGLREFMLDEKSAHLRTKAGKSGLFVTVSEPGGMDPNPNSGKGQLDASFTVTVAEDVDLNKQAGGTLKHRLSVARRIHRILKFYVPGGIAANLCLEKPGIEPYFLVLQKFVRGKLGKAPKFNKKGEMTDPGEAPTPDIHQIAFHSYVLHFRARLSDPTTYTKVATPLIAQVGPTVTVTCATGGAAIYYTTDSTHPWSGNTAATVYSAPFNPTAGLLLRACAFKAGSIASDVNSLTIA